MTQLSDDCFAFGGALMSADEALEILDRRIAPVTGQETVALSAALHRVLADDVVAQASSPPHDNAAVDGYALRFADLQPDGESRLTIAGRAAAGHPWRETVPGGAAVRIFTGAVMPEGLDTVVMQEDVTLDGDTVAVPPGLKPGANRRQAGEDIAAGDVILRRGTRLRPQEVALAAAGGMAELSVYRPVRVGLFSTGDEVREPGGGLTPGQIYDANRYMLCGLLQGLGCAISDLGILPDRADAVQEALAQAAGDHDLLLTSGGVSTGEEDHVKAAVEALGALHFWRLAIKPGRPLALGHVDGTAFVGLPGNPVAVMVCFLRFARPIVLRLGGAADLRPSLYKVPAAFAHRKKPDRREWVRARLGTDDGGRPAAFKFDRQGSGIISSLVAADGLVELPEQMTELSAGEMVDFLPFSEVLG